MKERLQHINTINSIVCMAEDAIKEKTGISMRLIIIPEANDMPPETTPGKMLHIIANAMDMYPSDFLTKSRKFGHVELRQMGCYFLKEYFPGMPLTEIGKLVGQDHTTVIHSIKRIKDKLDAGDVITVANHESVLNAVTQWMAIQ